MKRMRPGRELQGLPCSIVAVRCAGGGKVGAPNLVNDGYATLNEANKYIRANLKIKKRVNYKRGFRPKLKDLNLNGKAVVCVLGHFLYVDHGVYWSFFNNDNDDVVAVWIMEDAE